MRRPVALLLAGTLIACAAPRQDATASADRTPLPTRGPERYVAIGASDSVGVGAADPATGSWPARIAARLTAGSSFTNLGVSGTLAAVARAQQLPGAIAARPTLVTIWLAVNDLNNGIGSTAYRDVLGGMLAELVTRTEAWIFVGNVPDLVALPVNRSSVDPAALGAQVVAYNRWIAEMAAKYPARVVVVDLFTGSAELMSSATVSADGFHPTDRGYRIIADRFADAMRQAGLRLRD